LETSFARAFVSDISYINGNIITKLKSNQVFLSSLTYNLFCCVIIVVIDNIFARKLEDLLAIFGHVT